eukprot:gene4718-6027_t
MTELEQEKLKYQPAQQMELLTQLQTEVPNTEEQQNLYEEICGQAGCGKSTFAKKLMAFARSEGLIAKGCSSTGLSCQVYDDFSTAHSLFAIPVNEEDEQDCDHDASIVSTMKPERKELLSKT